MILFLIITSFSATLTHSCWFWYVISNLCKSIHWVLNFKYMYIWIDFLMTTMICSNANTKLVKCILNSGVIFIFDTCFIFCFYYTQLMQLCKRNRLYIVCIFISRFLIFHHFYFMLYFVEKKYFLRRFAFKILLCIINNN